MMYIVFCLFVLMVAQHIFYYIETFLENVLKKFFNINTKCISTHMYFKLGFKRFLLLFLSWTLIQHLLYETSDGRSLKRVTYTILKGSI